jgi:hypothetical protein
MFRFPNGHYFLIAGIIPTGEISGRYFYHTRKRGRTYGPDGTLFLKPEDWRPSFSSQQRGSGWDTLLPPDGLAAAHRVLVIRSPGQAEVVYEHTRVSGLPVHPSPAGPTEPITPPVIAEAADWLRENNLIPSHMSSDAGFHVAKRPPSAAWSATPLIASNVTAAVVVVGAGHIPDVTKPYLIIRVTVIERLRRANAFFGELVGAVLMTFLRACFANLIYAYMDCQSVIKIVQRNWKASSDAPEDRLWRISSSHPSSSGSATSADRLHPVPPGEQPRSHCHCPRTTGDPAEGLDAPEPPKCSGGHLLGAAAANWVT